MSNVQEQTSLMLGDRINWPFILGNAVMNFQNAIVKAEGQQSEQEVREAALVLKNLIPDAWTKMDEQFKTDLENATIPIDVDDRREFAGRKIGPLRTHKEDQLDPYRLAHACINVFQRRGLLSKTIYTEKIVPEPEDFEEMEKENENAVSNNKDREEPV